MGVFADRRAVGWAGLSVLTLLGGSFASLLLPADFLVLGVAAAVVAYIFCVRCALSRWDPDHSAVEPTPFPRSDYGPIASRRSSA